jgi:hypothetical protein
VAPRERELGSCCTAPKWCKASPYDTRAEGDDPATWSRGARRSARWSRIPIAYLPHTPCCQTLQRRDKGDQDAHVLPGQSCQ